MAASGGRVARDADPSLFLNENYLAPTVLLDVPEDNPAIREETFGPTLTITKVRDAEEALELANATSHGLAGGVLEVEGPRHGPRLPDAQRHDVGELGADLRLGAGGAALRRRRRQRLRPIHGEDGLKEFTRAKAITRQRVLLPVNLMSFGRPVTAADALARVMGMVHGRHR